MKRSKAENRRRRKRAIHNARRRIEHRLRDIEWEGQDKPMFRARSIHYEVSERARGIDAGGIGMLHRLARRIGLVEEIDRRVHLLKIHKPYHESDHVLNIACGGTCLETSSCGETTRSSSTLLVRSESLIRRPPGTSAGDSMRSMSRA